MWLKGSKNLLSHIFCFMVVVVVDICITAMPLQRYILEVLLVLQVNLLGLAASLDTLES
jgi:hypothetical protein